MQNVNDIKNNYFLIIGIVYRYRSIIIIIDRPNIHKFAGTPAFFSETFDKLTIGFPEYMKAFNLLVGIMDNQ